MTRQAWRTYFAVAAAIGIVGLPVGVAIAASVDNGVTATFDPSEPNGENGFYTSPVTISFSGAEGDTCEDPVTYAGPGGDPVQVKGTCTPADPAAAPYTGTFQFKYDDTAPNIADHDDITRLAGRQNSIEVDYTKPGATDTVDPSPVVDCTPAPGARLTVGVHTVSCSAEDDAGKTSTETFKITVDGAPTVDVPPDKTVEATSPSGAVVTFNVTAKDDEDPSPPTVECNKNSGAMFPLGETTVTCTARDDAGQESAPASFKVTVEDTTKPVFGPTPDRTLEADGPGGHKSPPAAYSVTATDVVDGPRTPACDPGPGADYPFGDTTVECTASDLSGNTAKTTFTVKVRDSQPPEFTGPPQDIVVQARNEDTGSPATDSCIQEFLNAPKATDVVDGSVPVSHDAPSQFPLGDTTVKFSASDSRGNDAAPRTAVVSVRRGPQDRCTIDARAPGNVSRVRVREGNRLVVLRWENPRAPDLKNVRVYRKRAEESGLGNLVFRGMAEVFRDRNVENDVLYVYAIRAFDEAGNHRIGVARYATPHRILLLRPRDGARVLKTRPPVLKWVEKRRARYYAVILERWANGRPRTVLVRWPNAARLELTSRWQFRGKRYRFTRGTYRWTVYPGFGPKSAGQYGEVMGTSKFRAVRRR